MNLVAALEKEHSVAMRTRITNWVGNNPKRFAALVKVFLEGPYRITQRAAWPISYCVESYPELAAPHLKALIRFMDKPGTHDAVRRNVFRLMADIEIPANLRGLAADASLRYLADTNQPVAIRVFAMSVLGNLAAQHPELANEIVPLVEEQLPYATPGFRSRARRVLPALKNLR